MQNLTEERTGQLIRELRLKAGWTQKELGMKIGISDKAISKWERGIVLSGHHTLTASGGGLPCERRRDHQRAAAQ